MHGSFTTIGLKRRRRRSDTARSRVRAWAKPCRQRRGTFRYIDVRGCWLELL